MPKRAQVSPAAPAAELKVHRLVEDHLALVEPIARAVYRKLPKGYIELADVVQAGRIGLIDAARKYREGSGTPFPWYARIRIRGAILDSIRCEPYAGWISNRREFPAELATESFEERLLNRPDARRHTALTYALASLDDIEKQALELKYVDGQRMPQVAKVLQISNAKAYKVHKDALHKLRIALRRAA